MRSRASRTWSCPENEVTPQGLYVRRREFLRLGAAGALGWAGAAMAISCKAAAKDNPASGLAPLSRAAPSPPKRSRRHSATSPATTTITSSALRRATRRECWLPQDQALDDLVRRRNQEAADRRHRRSLEMVPARGAHLPHALRRGLVDGHPVDRISARRSHQAARAHREGQVRGLHHQARSDRDAGPKAQRSRLALRRRASHGRGHEPARDPRGGALRPRSAQPERRATSPRRSLEVRLQGHQVHRARCASSITEPPTTWHKMGPDEYGFYANVNPEVDHPRWSQAKERRIGELIKRKTLPFNGYADQVASLYTGMDLRKFF